MRLLQDRTNPLKIEVEHLESRKLLAAFGTPWPDPHALSISFPEDGAGVETYSNVLRENFDQVAQRQQWQELALRAFQTWSVHADINVGLRNDHGLDFGTPGLSTSDPRFGDFRIGAIPQTGVLANVVPFQAGAGTYSGDILLNSNENFQYHDWADGVAPDTTNQPADARDLFSVLLHESGNALGLSDDNLSDWTVMFGSYTVPKGVLTQDDIDRIVELYGARSDPYEQTANDQMLVATLVPTPVGFQPDTDVITTSGSLHDDADIDVYNHVPLVGHDQATIRLKAAGISLLMSRVEVLDANGQILASGDANSIFDNDVVLQVSGLQNHSDIYVRVSGATQDLYSVGDYELEIDYRSAATRAADPVPGHYDAGADALFANFALADDEIGGNDSHTTAALAPQAAGFSPDSRYELESAVSSAADVDYWKIAAPSDVSGRLIVNLAGVGDQSAKLRARILDAAGQPVGVAGFLDAEGTWTLEVAAPQPDQEFFIRVSVDPNSAVGVGNYIVSAEFTTPLSQMNQLVSGDVSSSMDEFFRWTAGKSKLYRFDLSGLGAANDEVVQLIIYDAHSQEMRMVLAARSGVTRTGYAWLTEGDYILRVSAFSRSNADVNNMSFSVTVDGISDDQDPDDDPDDGDDPYSYYEYDPDTDPDTYEPYYYYYYYYP